MSDFIENIAIIQNNVVNLTPVLVSFYKNIKNQKNNILLSYLVFPIVLNQVCLDELNTFKSNSRLSRIVMNKKIMLGFIDRFEYFKQITNNCLQYAVDCEYIKIEEDLSITVINKDILVVDNSLDSNIRLASQLYKVFTLDVLNIYIAFGIKHV